eukprot:s208_g1.t1
MLRKSQSSFQQFTFSQTYESCRVVHAGVAGCSVSWRQAAKMNADESGSSQHDYQDHLSAYANMSSQHDYQDELVVPQQRHHGKSDDEVVLPRQEQHDEETTIPAEGAKGNSSATAFQVLPEVTTDEPVHIVLLGDSTLDNYRYLDLTAGERTVEMLLSKRCKEMNWELTVLAMDGSTLEDVAVRQVPVALAVLKGVARGDLDTG